jgi:hypothetical protein
MSGIPRIYVSNRVSNIDLFSKCDISETGSQAVVRKGGVFDLSTPLERATAILESSILYPAPCSKQKRAHGEIQQPKHAH